MNRNDRDWPAARAAAEARIKELGLSPDEAARSLRIPRRTLLTFLEGQTRPHHFTLSMINDALGLPHDHLPAIADKRQPRQPPPPPTAAPASGETPFAALLSLTDLAPGAQMVADYRAYVALVASELAEGMTKEQRMNTGRFMDDLSRAVMYGKWY